MENKKNDWKDPLYLDELLTEEEKSIRIKIKEYCQNKLLPSVIENNNKSIFNKNFYPDLGSLGFLGNTIKGYGSKNVYRSVGCEYKNDTDPQDMAVRMHTDP